MHSSYDDKLDSMRHNNHFMYIKIQNKLESLDTAINVKMELLIGYA